MCHLQKNTLDDNKVIAGKCGAIEAVVNAMKRHIDNSPLCQNGCGALNNITTNGNTSFTILLMKNCSKRENSFTNALDDNKVIAGKCGAIEAVVSVIKTHTDDTTICGIGCGTLIVITANNGK